MGERFFRVNEDCEIDGSFRLHYLGSSGGPLLPCAQIYDQSILIGIVDNNSINPKRMLLTHQDLQRIKVHIPSTGEIVRLDYPGKSGVIFTSSSPEVGYFKQVSNRILGGGTDRRDHLHVALVGAINSLGWKVIWAPLQMSGNLMHARMVSPSCIESGTITEKEAEDILKIFTKLY